ncbi:monovalent cation/H+ antiporter subunit D [Agarivorans sp. B2Z047]|uniref:monovalent cation/H+ antiporter subunit D n=1 Tax=Agarivorans sp. B2Z047 TaxID=2652721 RepID=UPI00128E710D|nr:monovalent cation/H+ antiporter subunit D [Agarivorans sp. B2Z047]MPW31747.1 monovalent cation/H+ antiporter subunit D [Agarivorans sp. B2Z047]UQN44809.1 monovalent cation/H+ antiporter subunit D [Agarivorans sp. B2Z047]
MSLFDHLVVFPVLIPFFVGVVLLFPSLSASLSKQRIFTIAANLLMVVVAIALLLKVQHQGIQMYALGDWSAPFGIVLVADAFSALMIALSAILGLTVILYASAGEDKNGAFFHPLIMFQLMGINGAFLTGDAFNLFVFFEVLLIASYSLMIHGGGKQKIQANIHYVFLNLIGSSLFLFALGTLYGTLGTLNFADMADKIPQLSHSEQLITKSGALLLLAVFGLKAAMLPLHFWLPKAYSSTSTPVAALFAIMTKVGIYSIWRIHGVMFGDQAGELANIALPWLWPIALLTIAIGAISVLASQSLRVLCSNLVIVSVGTLLVTISLNSVQASTAGIYYLVHSTIACAAMFLLAGLIQQQRGKAEDRFVTARAMPQSAKLGFVFALLAIGLIGMPPLSGFVGKALILQSVTDSNQMAWIWSLILGAGLISLIALSRAGTSLFWRTSGENTTALQGHPIQYLAIAILVGLLPLMVVFGGPLTDYAQLAAEQLNAGLSLQQLNEVAK